MKLKLMKTGLTAALGLLAAGSVWSQPSPGGTITFTATAPNPATVPTLSQWGLLVLALGLAFVTWRALKRSPKGARILSVLLASAALGLVAGALFQIRDAYSSLGIDASSNVGTPQDIYSNADVPVWNPGAQDVYVQSIQVNSGFVAGTPGVGTACQIGTRIPANSVPSPAPCYVRVDSTLPPP